MKLIKTRNSIINPDNVFAISIRENKIYILGNCDRDIEIYCDSEEDARKDFDKIFEELSK